MGEIAKVAHGSPAAKAGLEAGMKVLQVNDMEVRDIIQWKQCLAHPVMHIMVEQAGQTKSIKLRHPSGEDIGVVFASPTLDALRLCKNNCLFCFVQQMPPGQRDSLYVKDDDYRLSLVFGSFVTLTNVYTEEWQRIIRERISPIYVSVHTTNAELRVSLMRNPRAANISHQLAELIANGISVHVQLVLVPNFNDGRELERSLSDLVALYPGVESIAVVPVGLTGHRQGLPELCGFDKDSARDVLARLEKYRLKARRKHKRTLVYAADEFYILAERDFPAAGAYDDYPQLENGVGLSRLFVDEFKKALAAVKTPSPGGRVLWVTGEAALFGLKRLQHEINAKRRVAVDILPVPNLLFGGGVTVTGLLGGQDIARALGNATISPSVRVLIPDITLREGKFLDNFTIEQLQYCYPALNFSICPTTGEDLVRQTLDLKE